MTLYDAIVDKFITADDNLVIQSKHTTLISDLKSMVNPRSKKYVADILSKEIKQIDFDRRRIIVE